MTLPATERRCIGLGTEAGTPDAACLDCERRTAGIEDYTQGRRCWWMAPPTVQTCLEKLEKRK